MSNDPRTPSAQCRTPLAWSRLVDYWAGDLDVAASEDVEEHVFGCAACAAESARVAEITEALRAELPVVLSAEQVGELRARGLVVEENPVVPGTRRTVEFRKGVDILLHRLQGLQLTDAQSVRVTVRTESTGQVITEDHFAPFDRTRGEVVIACQRHFSEMPPDITFDVSAEDSAGRVSRATYYVPHVFHP